MLLLASILLEPIISVISSFEKSYPRIVCKSTKMLKRKTSILWHNRTLFAATAFNSDQLFAHRLVLHLDSQPFIHCKCEWSNALPFLAIESDESLEALVCRLKLKWKFYWDEKLLCDATLLKSQKILTERKYFFIIKMVILVQSINHQHSKFSWFWLRLLIVVFLFNKRE